MTNTEPRHKMTVKILDSLRTIQGYTIEEYCEAREELIDDLAADLEAIQLAKAIGNAAPVAPHGVEAQAPQPQAAWEQPVNAFQQATVPFCQHGARVPKSGTGAKGPWKAWMCSAPKGDPSQCSPQWVQRGTPEFNNFPA